MSISAAADIIPCAESPSACKISRTCTHMSAYADIIPWALRRRQHVGTLQFSVLARGDPLPDPRDPRKWGFWSFSAGDPPGGGGRDPQPKPRGPLASNNR